MLLARNQEYLHSLSHNRRTVALREFSFRQSVPQTPGFFCVTHLQRDPQCKLAQGRSTCQMS